MADISTDDLRSKLKESKKTNKRRTHTPKAAKNAYSWGEKPDGGDVPAKVLSKAIRFIFWKGLPGLIATHLCASVFVPELRPTRYLPKMDFRDHANVEMYAKAASLAEEDHPCAQAINAAYDKMESRRGFDSEADAQKMLEELDEGCAKDVRRVMREADAAALASRNASFRKGQSVLSSASQPLEGQRDCPTCPELVYVSAGPGRTIREDVTIVTDDFLMTRSEISIAEYREFVDATGHVSGNKCFTFERAEWDMRKDRNYLQPGFHISDDMPAACLSFEDATAYAKWISGLTGQVYRLPTLQEWGRAATPPDEGFVDGRVSDDVAKPMAIDSDAPVETCLMWNAADYSTGRVYPSLGPSECDDGFTTTAPLGAFVQPPFELANLPGNLWEWVVDMEHEGKDGWATVIGGSWASSADQMNPGSVSYTRQRTRASNIGFRLVREVPEREVNASGLRIRQS